MTTETANGGTIKVQGPWAQRALATLPTGISLVAADAEGISAALIDAVELRRSGVPFATFPVVQDERIELARLLGAGALRRAQNADQRRVVMDQIAAQQLTVNGHPQTELHLFDRARLRGLRDLALLGDIVLVRSQRERGRVEALTRSLGPQGPPRAFVAATQPDHRIGAPPRRAGANGVLIWAPYDPVDASALLAFALETWHAPVYLCAYGTALPGSRATIVSPAKRDTLWDAIGTVLVADPYDPAAALAFADAGYAVAAASSTGADEWVQGVALFDPWDHGSIRTAVTDAAGSPAPARLRRTDPSAELCAALDASVPAIPADPPLVTLVVPTRNRRGVLPRSIASISAQTYPNIEVIVVNDGGPLGEALEDCRFPIRLLEGERTGLNDAFNLGMRAAKGVYVAIQPDDDPLFPDHVARLVDALERNGAWMAHSRPVAAIIDPNDRGGYDLAGYEVVYDTAIDPLHFRWHNTIANTTIYRREALERYGWYDDGVGYLSDYDLWLRIFEHHDVVHVPAVTAELIWRTDDTNTSLAKNIENPKLYQALYDRHPAHDSATIESLRRGHLASLARASFPPKPQLRLDDPRCRNWLEALDVS